MTDREFAKEALDYIRAEINSDEHYFLSEKGTKHFKEFMSKYDEEEDIKDQIAELVCKVVAPLEKIKFFLNDVYIIDGKKCSNEDVIAKCFARMATLAESIAEDDDEAEVVEFESADHLLSKLFGGDNE